MEKLEPRLLERLDAQKTRATAMGMTAAEVDDRPLEVTISHQEYIKASEVEASDGAAALDELKREVQSSQRPILGRLEALGVRDDVTVSALANSVTVQQSAFSRADGAATAAHARRPRPPSASSGQLGGQLTEWVWRSPG